MFLHLLLGLSSPPLTFNTCHIRWADRVSPGPDAQLAVAVRAPALDPAPGSGRARVAPPHGDGDGG
jgi:hypothetical protein